MVSAGGPELVDVRVREFPLDVYRRASESFEGLQREFALVAMRTPAAEEVPARLLALVEALTGEYAGLNDAADQVRDAAIERGQKSVEELVYRLPRNAVEACIALNDMLDEADEFCRRGDVLLSLAAPPEAVAFRRWYLGEMVAQLRGEPPLAWTDADHDALVQDRRLRGAR